MNLNDVFQTIPGMAKALELHAAGYADEDVARVQAAAARAETEIHPDVADLVKDRTAEAYKAGALWLVNMIHEAADSEQQRQQAERERRRPRRRMPPAPPRMRIG